jgi:hypothetical protein
MSWVMEPQPYSHKKLYFDFFDFLSKVNIY